MWLKGRAFALNQLMNRITDLHTHIRFSRIFFSSLIGRHFCLYTRKTISDFFFLFFYSGVGNILFSIQSAICFCQVIQYLCKTWTRYIFERVRMFFSVHCSPFRLAFIMDPVFRWLFCKRQITTKEKESKLNFCVCFFLFLTNTQRMNSGHNVPSFVFSVSIIDFFY